MIKQYLIVIEIDASGGNVHHLIAAEDHAKWRVARESGESGQDRESYSDTQDRESYMVEDDPDNILTLARNDGFPYDTWKEVEAQVRANSGEIIDIIAATDAYDD